MVTEWGETWQVDFTPEKTQAMVISRSPAASLAVSGCLCLGGQILPLQESIKVLGVTVDCGLRFDRHVTAVAHQASLRVSALCRMAGSLDSRGILTLYKAQIRPCMEYGALSWMLSAATHLQRLDAVQHCVLRLVGIAAQQQQQEEQTEVTSLEHRRDVLALVVQHKARVLEVPHLSSLRLPARAVQRESRATTSSDMLVHVPRSHSRQHQRSYTTRTARLWNAFTAATSDTQTMMLQQMKVCPHRWQKTQTPTLELC
ncbi:RNA-directed DNA polymerase from mobile element jockey [Portunus trituberculatus]|uniref:RNA-directed DNA polymerase from mobile element jockey n=1 Tax=Portunus trituberculatus TaxID=210409 RepID=A0A5B7JE82_PORTR|nr:RNA-directed DNA polymerase from mobile element jockey [Portunus trituberculatus]